MSYIEINEAVKVWAFFDDGLPRSVEGGIFPIAISWRRRLIRFQKLIFQSARKIGETKIVSLVVSADNSNYELEYNLNTFVWKLKRVTGE